MSCRRMPLSRLLAAIAVVSLSLSVGCFRVPINDDGSSEVDASDGDNTSGEPDSGPNPPEDVNEPDSSDSGDDQDTSPPDDSPGVIPDRVTTDGGESFSSELDGGDTASLTLVANQDDVVVIRMRTDAGDPQLYLYRPDGGSSNDPLAWHDTDDSTVHIPYQDNQLSEGWEFYQGGEHELELRNDGSGTVSFEFDLTCLAGPCTDGGSGGGSGDGVAEANDNCPETDNPSQTNQDGDIFGDACDPDPNQVTCPDMSGAELEQRIRAAYRNHSTQSYDAARQDLYSTVDNYGGTVETIYTGRTITTNGIPDPSNVNTEHTVPRSTIDGEGAPFTDLHHLFPADSETNSRRSNYSFDEVVSASWSNNGTRLGASGNGYTVFEPRDAQKGRIARAVFYFATVYDREIQITLGDDGRGQGLANESTLREWHNQVDPVSSKDETRNDRVFQIQETRNPFVDCPGLVSDISNF